MGAALLTQKELVAKKLQDFVERCFYYSQVLSLNIYIYVLYSLWFRFSVHKVDLKFLDKLSTQLTHTQVEIKAEVILYRVVVSRHSLAYTLILQQVAASNSKSQELLQIMHTLKEDCNTCQHPTPDKPVRHTY